MYYLIEKSTTSSGVAKAFTDKSDLTQAQMAFHQTIASAMANSAVQNILVMVIDERGGTQNYEYWERPILEAEE